jgi:hypothetical protein
MSDEIRETLGLEDIQELYEILKEQSRDMSSADLTELKRGWIVAFDRLIEEKEELELALEVVRASKLEATKND